MTIETALYPTQLNATLPPQSDIVREGAGHLRLIKTVAKTTFPNLGGAWNATQTEANYIVGVTSPIQAQINSKGAITGQTWTGAHVFSGSAAVPTLAQGANTTGAASTAFVQAEWATRLPNYTAPIFASTTELNYLVGLTGAIQPQLSNQVSGPIHAAPSKATPVDADELGLSDSAASWGLKKLTFANLKAWIGGLFVSKSGDTMTGNLMVEGVGHADVAVRSYGYGGDGATMHGYQSRGTKALPTAPTAGDPIFGIGARPYTGAGWAEHSVGAVHIFARQNITPAQQGTSFRIATTPLGGTWSDRIHAVAFECDGVGQGARWRAKFSGATQADRTFVQDASGATTAFGVLAGGASGSSAAVNCFSRSNPDNSPYVQLAANEAIGMARVYSGALGTALPLPLVLGAGSVLNALTIDTAGNILATSGAIGYGIGAGGTVVQAPNNTSDVVLNKPNGTITLATGDIPGNGIINFVLQNSLITDKSIVVVHGVFDGSSAAIAQFAPQAAYVQSGHATIQIKNNNPSAVSTDNVKIKFAVFEGSAS